MHGSNMGELKVEIGTHFKALFDWLVEQDKKIVVFSWKGKQVLKRGAEIPTNRRSLEVFTEGLFIQQAQSTWTRILIGHDTPVDTMLESDWQSINDYGVTIAKLQVKNTCSVGWLLGSHRDMNNADLGSAIYASTKNTNKFPIAIKFMAIRTNPGKLGKAERVVAAHIKTDYSKAPQCREMLFAMYRSGNKAGYPLGIKMRFAPNTADTCQPVTIHTRNSVKILKNKQKVFLETLGRLSSGAIQGLDYVEPSLGITLRHAVMDICSQIDGKPLFISVNEEDWSSRVTFLFPETSMEEAVTMIPALPIIMATKYGPRAWSWFNEHAKVETAGWFYDEATGAVCSDEDIKTDKIVKEYEGNSDLESDD